MITIDMERQMEATRKQQHSYSNKGRVRLVGRCQWRSWNEQSLDFLRIKDADVPVVEEEMVLGAMVADRGTGGGSGELLVKGT